MKNKMDVKIYAYYLPQYHRTPENDEWWGKGFTEWTAVRNACPIFEGHKQPVVPFNNYYYDLMDKKVMSWQADLMRKYGIDGLCIYHYWFDDGRKVLEKPVENLLEWRDIELPYCLCWANESWVRTWTNIRGGGNSWAAAYESVEKNTENGILLRQSYGLEEEWKKHFEYLLPFFRDSRYLCLDNKPIFVIYKPMDIPCLCAMKDYWNTLAKESGLDGLSIINAFASVSEVKDEGLYVQRSPGGVAHVIDRDISGVGLLSYDETWNRIINDKVKRNCFRAGFVAYDDTPRRGKNGEVYVGSSPSKFEKNLTMLLEKSASEGKEIVFLNAWNEWGEGMYLEPDQNNGYAFLEAVRESKRKYDRRIKEQEEFFDNNAEENLLLKRTQHNLEMIDKWLYIKNMNHTVSVFLKKRGINKVIIYGYGILGRHLVDDLRNNGVDISLVVDKQIQNDSPGFSSEIPMSICDDVDCIVVSATNYFDEIYSELRLKGFRKRIINLDQMIVETE